MSDEIANDSAATSILHSVPTAKIIKHDHITPAAGALAGFISGVTVCPLDVAKTRIQAQGAILNSSEMAAHVSRKDFRVNKYRGVLDTIKVIWLEEGTRGLYRGLVPLALGYFPTWMIYFTVYEKMKHSVRSWLPNDNYVYFLSAITAGAVSATATNPIWVVKTRLMLQTGNGQTIYDRFLQDNKDIASEKSQDLQRARTYYKGTWYAFRKMYRMEGIRSFYAGLLPSYFGLVHVAIHFPLYENCKKQLRCTSPMDISSPHPYDSMLLRLISASCLSKMAASAFTYPHEIIRTRMQIAGRDSRAEHSILKILSGILQKEGMKGFYSGFAVNLTRTVPSSAITLVSFEYIRSYLESL